MVDLSKEDKKKLLKITKKTKWRELKEIEPINETIKELDIYDDQVNLLCSEYLILAGKTGEFDEEEMFRQCREADKVKKRLLKKTEREGKKGLKQGKGGRGGGGGSDRKLIQSTIKDEQETKAKKETDKSSEDALKGINNIASTLVKSFVKNNGDFDKIFEELVKDENLDKIQQNVEKVSWGFLMGLISIFEGENLGTKGIITLSTSILSILGGFLKYIGVIDYGMELGKNFMEYIKDLGVVEYLKELGKSFWNYIKEMMGWLKDNAKSLYDGFTYNGGGGDDPSPPGGEGGEGGNLQVDTENPIIQDTINTITQDTSPDDRQDPPDNNQDPSRGLEVVPAAATNISPEIISNENQQRATNIPQRLDPQTQQLLTANQLQIDKILSTPPKKEEKNYSDDGSKPDVEFNIEANKNRMKILREQHPDKYGDWSDEKFKTQMDKILKQKQAEDFKKVLETKSPQEQAPLVAEGYGYTPMGKNLPSTEGKTTPKSYWETFSNFGEYMPSATSLITTGLIGAYGVNAYLKGQDAVNQYENMMNDPSVERIRELRIQQEEQDQLLQDNKNLILDKTILEAEQDLANLEAKQEIDYLNLQRQNQLTREERNKLERQKNRLEQDVGILRSPNPSRQRPKIKLQVDAEEEDFTRQRQKIDDPLILQLYQRWAT